MGKLGFSTGTVGDGAENVRTYEVRSMMPWVDVKSRRGSDRRTESSPGHQRTQTRQKTAADEDIFQRTGHSICIEPYA